jgi:hypothetical protein
MCILYRGKVYTEPLPSNDIGTHLQTHGLKEGFMKYVVEIGSGAKYTKFHKDCFSRSKIDDVGGYTDSMVIS